jgi:hypothetical protein
MCRTRHFVSTTGSLLFPVSVTGAVATNLTGHMFDLVESYTTRSFSDWLKSAMEPFVWQPRDAALTELYAAVGPSLKIKKLTGLYYHPIARVASPDLHAQGLAGTKLRAHLWKLTEDFIATH